MGYEDGGLCGETAGVRARQIEIAQARKLIAVTWMRVASRLSCLYADALEDEVGVAAAVCYWPMIVSRSPLLPRLVTKVTREGT